MSDQWTYYSEKGDLFFKWKNRLKILFTGRLEVKVSFWCKGIKSNTQLTYGEPTEDLPFENDLTICTKYFVEKKK